MGHDNPADQSFIERIQVDLAYEHICSCRALDAGTLLHLKHRELGIKYLAMVALSIEMGLLLRMISCFGC
jgi:hypothetical protein